MYQQLTLTINEGFELAALLPCLLVVVYLLWSKPGKFSDILLPVIYFSCLASSFLLPIYHSLPDFPLKHATTLLLSFAESSLPEVSFLLIMQFVKQRLPDLKYFLILAVPLVGGAPFTYMKTEYDQVCLAGANCFSPEQAYIIYQVVTASMVFLLLLFSLGKYMSEENFGDENERSRYWLIVSLLLFNLGQLGVDLARINRAGDPRLLFIHTMIGVAFVYLALCSVFRVFNKSFSIEPVELTLWQPAEKDLLLAEKIANLMEGEKLYRQVGFSRRLMAEKLCVNETILSRVINWKFEKSFRELINHYRIDEAKKLLLETEKPITVIAFETGFKSITSFNRVFKESTGLSATGFKSERRKSEVAEPVKLRVVNS